MEYKLKVTEFGYRQLDPVPSKEYLGEYYSKKYYQSDVEYKSNYSPAEKRHIQAKIEQKYLILNSLYKGGESYRGKVLEIGAGEGWGLGFLHARGWDVKGIDYSNHGVRTHNPQILDRLEQGDAEEIVKRLVDEGKKYNLIWLDNVLEHMREPDQLLKICVALADKDCVLVVDVPNDFSVTQLRLKESGLIERDFWVIPPDHISYFTKESLTALCKHVGWSCKDFIADYPIDLMAFNPDSNYVNNPKVGKNCHATRVAIENFFHDISPEKTNNYYRALADLGIGRTISGFFKLER